MAYSLTDHYRTLRAVMRINGIMTGLGLGLLLTVLPRSLLATWGLILAGPTWPLRLAGVCLITLGIHMMVAAHERIISLASLLTALIGNGLIAIVLLVAYLQRDLANLLPIGRIFLMVIVLLSLLCALVALRYLHSDYGRD